MKNKFYIIYFLMFFLFFSLSVFAGSKEKVIIGKVELKNLNRILNRYKPLLKYLKSETGYDFDIKFTKNYTNIIENNLIHNEYDIVVFDSVSYIEATEQSDFRAFVKPVRQGRTYFHSIILIDNKKNKIKSITDLNNRKLAFSDFYSTAGFIYPIVELYKINIKPQVCFVGHQANSNLLGYIKEFFPAVSCDYTRQHMNFPVKFKELRILYRTEQIPNEPWSINESLPEEMKQKIMKAFLKLNLKNTNTEIILGRLGFDEFVRAEDKDYDSIRKVYKEFNRIKDKISYLNFKVPEKVKIVKVISNTNKD